MIPDNPRDAGMKKLFVVPLPSPLISKSNEKNGGRFLSAKYRVFEESVARMGLSVCRRPMIEVGWIVIRPCFKNRVHIDLTNSFKSCLDGLVKGGVFKDDKYIRGTVTEPIYGLGNSEAEIWA